MRGRGFCKTDTKTLFGFVLRDSRLLFFSFYVAVGIPARTDASHPNPPATGGGTDTFALTRSMRAEMPALHMLISHLFYEGPHRIFG